MHSRHIDLDSTFMEGGLAWRLGGVWRLKRSPSLANAASDFGEERAASKKDPSQVMSKWVRRGRD